MLREPFRHFKKNRLEIDKEINASDKNIILGITTRHGGVSEGDFSTFNLGLHVHDDKVAVIQNRNILAQSLNEPLDQWVFAEQVHHNVIQKVGKAQGGRGKDSMETTIEGCDGLYTIDQDIMLALCYADCVPLYFFSTETPIVGIAHAGWRGTVNKIAVNMVHEWLLNEHIPLESIHVTIGPSIDECCYEVDQTVMTQVNGIIPSMIKDKIYKDSTNPNHYMLNLKELNYHLLITEAGIPKENLQVSSLCTSCRTDLFYSHRKENGHTGRMLGYIGMK